MWRALNDYKMARQAKVGGKNKSADFSDSLVVNTAMLQAREWRQVFEGFYTFDVTALEIPGTLSP